MLTGVLETRPAQMRGPLSQSALVQVLRALFVGRLTGRLLLLMEGEELALSFISGHIVSGSSGPLAGRLGEILARSGILSRADLDQSLEQAAREGRRLGPVLVERRLVSPAQIEEALRLQVRGVLFTAFFWRGGAFQFEPNDGSTNRLEEVSVRLSTPQLILEVIAAVDAAEAVREALGDLDRRLVAVDDPQVHLEGVTLSPGDAFVLSRADGFLTAREILEITPLPRETVERSLLALLSVGVVEWRMRHLPRLVHPNQTVVLSCAEVKEAIAREDERLTIDRLLEIDETFSGLIGKTHHDVLGVAVGATAAEVRDAYQKLTRRFHPDAVGEVPAEQAAKVRAIFMRVSEAFNTLRPTAPEARPESRSVANRSEAPAPPAPPTPTPAPEAELSVEDMLAKAEEALAERPWETLAAVERILPDALGPIRQRARLLRARAQLKNPVSWREGELELREILQADPTLADAALLLGAFYKDRGLTARATAMFRKVLELRPGHRRATGELANLAPAAPVRRAGMAARS